MITYAENNSSRIKTNFMFSKLCKYLKVAVSKMINILVKPVEPPVASLVDIGCEFCNTGEYIDTELCTRTGSNNISNVENDVCSFKLILTMFFCNVRNAKLDFPTYVTAADSVMLVF